MDKEFKLGLAQVERLLLEGTEKRQQIIKHAQGVFRHLKRDDVLRPFPSHVKVCISVMLAQDELSFMAYERDYQQCAHCGPAEWKQAVKLAKQVMVSVGDASPARKTRSQTTTPRSSKSNPATPTSSKKRLAPQGTPSSRGATLRLAKRQRIDLKEATSEKRDAELDALLVTPTKGALSTKELVAASSSPTKRPNASVARGLVAKMNPRSPRKPQPQSQDQRSSSTSDDDAEAVATLLTRGQAEEEEEAMERARFRAMLEAQDAAQSDIRKRKRSAPFDDELSGALYWKAALDNVEAWRTKHVAMLAQLCKSSTVLP